MDDKNNSDIICIFIIDGKYSYLNAFTISCWRLRMSDVNLSLSLFSFLPISSSVAQLFPRRRGNKHIIDSKQKMCSNWSKHGQYMKGNSLMNLT